MSAPGPPTLLEDREKVTIAPPSKNSVRRHSPCHPFYTPVGGRNGFHPLWHPADTTVGWNWSTGRWLIKKNSASGQKQSGGGPAASPPARPPAPPPAQWARMEIDGV